MKQYFAEIVAAYLQQNAVALSDMSGVITQIYQSLAELGRPPIEPPEGPRKPAVPIRRSVVDELVICLECGAKSATLRRHLDRVHSLTPDEYHDRWRLPARHPLVAPNYTARRSEAARARGFGSRGNANAKKGRGPAGLRPV